MTIAGMLLVLAFLIQSGAPFFLSQGIEPLWGKEWYPYEALFGLLPALIGTIWGVVIALACAVPLAIIIAIFSQEIVSGRIQFMIRSAMELLAAIPSVCYGLIGIWILLPFLEHTFGLLTGHSLLAAGILLAIMILPGLALLTEEALAGVVLSQRESAKSLGMGWPSILYRVLLPQAWPGIRFAVLISSGRALGETIAVMLVVGSIDRIPDPWYRIVAPAQTLTSRIGRETGEATFGSLHWSALMGCGLILAMLSILINLFAGRRLHK